jgi:hypothetical protein
MSQMHHKTVHCSLSHVFMFICSLENCLQVNTKFCYWHSICGESFLFKHVLFSHESQVRVWGAHCFTSQSEVGGNPLGHWLGSLMGLSGKGVPKNPLFYRHMLQLELPCPGPPRINGQTRNCVRQIVDMWVEQQQKRSPWAVILIIFSLRGGRLKLQKRCKGQTVKTKIYINIYIYSAAKKPEWCCIQVTSDFVYFVTTINSKHWYEQWFQEEQRFNCSVIFKFSGPANTNPK